jgi:hypothetical protein
MIDHDPDVWDTDPVAQFVTELIGDMPDRPKMVVVVLNWGAKNNDVIVKAILKIKESCFKAEAYEVYGMKMFLVLLSFENDSGIGVCRLFDALSELPPTAETIVYIEGMAKFRVARTKKKLLNPQQEQI